MGRQKQRETVIRSQNQERDKAATEDAGGGGGRRSQARTSAAPRAGSCWVTGRAGLGRRAPALEGHGRQEHSLAAERSGPGAETDLAQRSAPWAAPVCRSTPPALTASAGGCRLLPS